MKPSPRSPPGRVAVGEPGVREVVAVETLDDGEPGRRRSLSCFARSLFVSSVSSRRWTASTWRGVAQPANSSMLALEMNSLRAFS